MKNLIKTQSKISITPEVRFGRPCVTGTRIAVADILNLIEAGYTLNEIPKQYPAVSLQDAKIALRYTSAYCRQEKN